MNTYYDTLGLEPGASQAEIKKAYFKLVRQYSPESDPEQFQKIREAYEQLKKEGDTLDGPVFPSVSDPWAGKMMEQIDQCRRNGDSEKFRDTCEEAWRLFPQEIQFLYLLVIAQRQCGNTGKAVKNGELLVSKEPDNKWFHKELALSYIERGFTQKAYFACEKAYELGCRDNDFLLTYAMECDEYGEYDKGIQILLGIVKQDRRWAKEDIPELVEAYVGILAMNSMGSGRYLTEVVEGLCRSLEQYKVYLAEYIPELAVMLSRIGVGSDSGADEYQAVRRVFHLMDEAVSEPMAKEVIRMAKDEFNYRCIVQDERIGEILEAAYEVYFDLADIDERTKKFALTDVQLCMLEEREQTLEQAEILREEYPDYYEKLKDFIRRLQAEQNLLILKDSLLKTYYRLAPDFADGLYFEKYPQEKEKAQGIVISDGASYEPYVRSTKKVGRNDPCPCGSGKKYKHCCMK
ncbi:MAG: DnaJ domain-containing protein [Lachnospiraceae bacterium]|nr:DnaJ domain-containing protein [Lachnospiraceae bacterium]